MENPRPEKVAIVTEVKERMEQSASVVVTEYRGLTVKQLAELRRALRSSGGKYKVYKNTLVRRAASEIGVDLDELLVGPTALTFTETTPEGDDGDIVGVAKALKDFAKNNPQLVIKGGLLDGDPVDADSMNKLADIEPREVLLAKLAGMMAAPMQQFAGLLQAVPRDFAYGLQALIDQGGAGDAPAAEANADAPADAEAEATDDAAPAAAEADTEDNPAEDDNTETEES
ncbi:MAG: 50S ribosomal protein L10 [Actinomycetota bacterium]